MSNSVLIEQTSKSIKAMIALGVVAIIIGVFTFMFGLIYPILFWLGIIISVFGFGLYFWGRIQKWWHHS